MLLNDPHPPEEGRDPTPLEENVLMELEKVGFPTQFNDDIMKILSRAEELLFSRGEDGTFSYQECNALIHGWPIDKKSEVKVYCPRCDEMEEVESSCAANY